MLKQLIVVFAVISLTFACKSQKSSTTNTQQQTQAEPMERTSSRQQGGQDGRQGPPSIDEVFKMDTNSDGKLGKAEVKGRLLKDFARFDSNNDGFITREEFKNAPKPEKGQRPQRN